MRVTNNMITGNTKYNINSNKVLVDKYNTQMTTHKKINKPSEDPVIAIRSLHMQTDLAHLTQYLDNNIEDANSWLKITETALKNMKDILTRVRTQCVHGTTDTLEAKDRDTILKELQALQEQLYTEGNADYAGRTVFTGYRTNCMFTFKEDEPDTFYKIKENFTYEDLKEQRYYYGKTEIPADTDDKCDTVVGTQAYNRLRLAYGNVNVPPITQLTTDPGSPGIPSDIVDAGLSEAPAVLPDLKVGDSAYYLAPNGIDGMIVTGAAETMISVQKKDDADPTEIPVKVYDTEQDWIDARMNPPDAEGRPTELGDNEIVLIKDKGELIFGDGIAHDLASGKASIEVNYTKTGFDKNEPRPEYYFDCKMQTPEMKEEVEYTKEEQKIAYMISNNITLEVNTEASDVFRPDIGRDVAEMIDIVANAINANEKVDKLEQMMQQEQFSDDKSQEVLQTYLDAAEKEAAYANDHLQKTFRQYITNFDNYLEDVNIGITNVGSLTQRLDMTQNRVENQKMTMELLKSSNEDRDISDIIIDYYAAYNAYTASLTAASKVGQQTLLNYL